MNADTPQWPRFNRAEADKPGAQLASWLSSNMANTARTYPIAKLLAELVGCTEGTISASFAKRALDLIALFDFKQQRYGMKNIQEGGLPGLAKRCKDKIERLENMLTLKMREMKNCGEGVYAVNERSDEKEPRLDSWRDIACLALIGVMVEEEAWPSVRNLRLVEMPSPVPPVDLPATIPPRMTSAERELHEEDERAEGTYSHPVKCECNDVELNLGCPIHKAQAEMAKAAAEKVPPSSISSR